MKEKKTKHSVVIVGGGVGGLELATRLGRKFRSSKFIDIHLVDKKLTHIWKPLLHEVAVGTLDVNQDEINYLAHGHANGYQFEYGEMVDLDRSEKAIVLGSIADQKHHEMIPKRKLRYDTLVLAVGSVANTFSVQGADKHCFFLDSLEESKQFHQIFVENIIRHHYKPKELPSPFSVAVIGGGATGIELAAEINYALSETLKTKLGLHASAAAKVYLVEASERILPQLPEKISKLVVAHLDSLGICVNTSMKVNKITKDQIFFENGQTLDVSLVVWVAGIKAPDWLGKLDGLEVNALNQLKVKSTLQTTLDDVVFVLGDCAWAISEGQQVPPKAQAAHQQAYFLAQSIRALIKGKELPHFTYHDKGSLLNLSNTLSCGAIMGKYIKSIMIQGFLARVIYLMLYRMHLLILHGWRSFLMVTIGSHFNHRVKPRLKLH